jgi:hypothetical protein
MAFVFIDVPSTLGLSLPHSRICLTFFLLSVASLARKTFLLLLGSRHPKVPLFFHRLFKKRTLCQFFLHQFLLLRGSAPRWKS